ncbi:MAG TPA: hypothetical protein VFW96_21610 [Thermomicrobiales bacterium]|nr:hypothetical protein [Thermomicrobiales bacterium]
MSAPVALAATLHDPGGALLPLLRPALPDLARRYAGLAILATDDTAPALLDLLRAAGAAVESRPADYAAVGRRRLDAVRRAAGLAPEVAAVHLCDFDRLLHWWHAYPDELADVVAHAARVDLLILGRTARAWATHPAVQVETEHLANRAASLLYGAEVDVCAGSRGLSRRAVDYLVARSRERGVGADAEWPLLLRHAGSFACAQRLTEGLEFETADRFPEEVARAGGPAAWNAALDRDPARWAFRAHVAADIVDGALRTALALGVVRAP